MPVEHIEKRRNYFIKKKFQTEFVIRFCVLVICSAVISGVILYFFLLNTATTAFVNSRLTIVRTSDYIVPSLLSSSLISVVLIGLATIFVVIFLSHRIAGALFGIERRVIEAIGGDLTLRIRLRAKDEIVALADSFNKMLVATEDKVREIKAASDKLQREIEKLSQLAAKDNNAQDLIRELKAKKGELDKAIGAFKIGKL